MQQISENANKTPIEIALGIDDNGCTTAKKLYEFLELNPGNYSRWCKRNIVDNEFAEENVDFWAFFLNEEWGGQATQDYKLTAHFAKKLSMQAKGQKADLAREYFTVVEEKAKEYAQKQAFDRSALSPELQMFYSIADAQAKHELEIKRQGEQIAKVEQKVDAIQEIMVTPIGDWKADINKRVREISIKSDTDYQSVWGQLYGELETTAHCSLNRLCNNKRARMEKAGNTKAAIKDGTTKIAIIYDKPQLKAIFESIVKNHAMRYV